MSAIGREWGAGIAQLGRSLISTIALIGVLVYFVTNAYLLLLCLI